MALVDERGRRTAPTRQQLAGRNQSNPRVSARARNVRRPKVVPSQVRDDKSDADRARAKPYVDQAIERARTDQFAKTFGAQVVAARKKEKKRGGGRSPFIPAVMDSVKGTGALQSASKAVAGAVGKTVRPVMAIGTLGATELPVVGEPARDLVKHAVQDAINLPAQAIPSVYHLGDRVAHGDLEGVARDLAQPYVDVAEDPVGSFTEHPLNTYLLGAGVKGGAGRGAGAAMRAVPGPTRRLASTERVPRTVEGSGIRQERTYSPDVITKAGQVAAERSRDRAARALEARAEKAGGRKGEALLRRAAQVRGDGVKTHELQRRVDERADVNEAIRREDRTRTVAAATKAISAVKAHEQPLVSLVAQGIIKPDRESLAGYVRQVTADTSDLTPAKRAANRELVEHARTALAGGVDWGRVQRAASAYREVRAPLDAELGRAGILAADQIERRRLLPYAVQHMKAEHDPELGFVVRKEGEAPRQLSNQEIRAHMKENGFDEPTYLTQAPNKRGARNFFRNQMEPANAGGGTFTGEATRRGTLDIHPDTLVENVANAQSLVSQQHGFTELVGEFGHRKAGGELRTYDSFRSANQAASNLMHTAEGGPRAGAVRWRPIRVNPFGGSRAQLDHLLEQADLDPSARQTLHDAMDSALQGHEGDGPWALVPEPVADRMREHLRVLGSGGPGKTAQVATQAFKRAVLATSVKWLFGNVAEGVGRAAVAHAGPRAWVTGGKVMKSLEVMDPKAAQALRARALGGGHISMAERTKLRRAAEDFENTRLKPLATALGAFWRAPGPKQVAGLWGIWTDIAFNQLSGRFESQVQQAMFGRAVRRSPLMEGSMRKTGQEAISEAARGLRNTETQVAMARQVDRAYGRYSKFSPAQRKYIATYTPFAAWTLAATTFVYRVLPKDHPVLTSLLAAANEATEEWRKEHGLDLFSEGRLPGFLQGSFPIEGGHIRASRYSPTGAFTDLGDTLASAVLPQASGVLAALKGEDWKGKELRDDNGQPVDFLGRAKAAAGSFLESTVPILAQAKRVAKNGIGREINPFPVTPNGDRPVGTGTRSKGGFQGTVDPVEREEIRQLVGEAASQAQLDEIERDEIRQLVREAAAR